MFGRLFFDNEITNFLQVSSNNKISMIMLNGSQGAIIEVGNFIRRDRSKIDVVSFIPIKKIDFDADKLGWDDVDNLMIQSTNRINVKIGRFLRKFLSSQSIVDFGISDKDIEDFVLNDRIEGVKKFEVNATPTIIINGKKFNKTLNYKNLKKYLEKLI